MELCSGKLLNFASVLTTSSPGLDPVQAMDIQDGDTEGGGALVLMMVRHVDSHQDTAASHLLAMSQCYHMRGVISHISIIIIIIIIIITSSLSQVGNSITSHRFLQA